MVYITNVTYLTCTGGTVHVIISNEVTTHVICAQKKVAVTLFYLFSCLYLGFSICKEEVEAELSPAMNAAIKIFMHINEIEVINSDGTLSASAPEICSVRLLVPFAQAVHLIGKQGVTIKPIQESTGTTIRIIDEGMLLSNSIQIVQLKGCIY